MKLTTPQMKPTPLNRAARWRRGGVTVGVAAIGLSLAALAAPANAATHPAASKSRDGRSRSQNRCELRQNPRRPKGAAAVLRHEEHSRPLGMHQRLPYRLATIGAFQGPEGGRGRPGCEGFGDGQGSLRDTGHLERQGPVHLH